MSAPKAEAAGLTVERREEMAEHARQAAHRLGPLHPCYGAGAVLALLDALAAAEAERDEARAAVADAWDEGWLASKRHERSEGQPKMSYWPNPYRAALDTATSEGA